MKLLRMLVSGIAGATALTLAHETLRRYVPDAPRMDVLGERGIKRVLEFVGVSRPQGDGLHNSALAGDLIGNSLYYSQIGAAPRGTALFRGISVGMAAGIGAVKVPEMLGMGKNESSKNLRQQLMTIGLYTIGGIAAALAAEVTP